MHHIIRTISITLFILFSSACNESSLFSKDPNLGFACLELVSHEGPLSDIETNYRAKGHQDKQESCEENQILVAEKAGTYDFRIAIEARGGEIRGMAEIDLVEKGDNGTIESWLIGSPCMIDGGVDQTGDILHLESGLGISRKNGCTKLQEPRERYFEFLKVYCLSANEDGEDALELCPPELEFEVEDDQEGRYAGNDNFPVWLQLKAPPVEEVTGIVVTLKYDGPDPITEATEETEEVPGAETPSQILRMPIALQPTG